MEKIYPGNCKRRLPVGAEIIPGKGVHFRVWAPHHRSVEVILEHLSPGHSSYQSVPVALTPEKSGYFSGLVSSAGEGTLYRFRIDGNKNLFPDPASRFQPLGPDGPSEVINPANFVWTDKHWRGLKMEGQVLYELHIGTFTEEGDFAGASSKLGTLAETGITLIELMPVADFPGKFGWGYDGVNLFAPTHLYGRPDDFRYFVDRAHTCGIGVILDVVYNHIGPVANYLSEFSTYYFTDKYRTDWGQAINYDGPGSGPVREYFLTNAFYWISEFHLDGLRLDATQQIFDTSSEHIIAAIGNTVRKAAAGRETVVIAENETQDTRLVLPRDRDGYGLDGLWNDDFHHSVIVAMTGHNEAYYSDYLGTPQELISSLKYGFLYQGQYYSWQKQRRGTPALDIDPAVFIIYLQNHDQIANSGYGLRIDRLTSPGLLRAITALLLLAPETPLLFQGQEFAASSPFYYFSDISPETASSIYESRIKFLSQFRNLAQPEMRTKFMQPSSPLAFRRSKLKWRELQRHIKAYSLHHDLLKMRKEDPVFRSQKPGGLDGAVLSASALVLRYFGEPGDDRLLLINLGHDLHLKHIPEPLLAPPAGKFWQLIWSSEDPRYGGSGTPPLETEVGWDIPGQAAAVLKSI